MPYNINPIVGTIDVIDITMNKIKDDINKRLNHIDKISKRERWVKYDKRRKR